MNTREALIVPGDDAACFTFSLIRILHFHAINPQ